LAATGASIREGVGKTGLVVTLENGPGPVVWLRADMDALPLEEKTGLDYASTVGGASAVMHACGHDMHVTWLVGAVEQLAATTAEWSGTVVAIFQPAEEVAQGAQAMVDDGLVALAPHPDVVLGQHVSPLPAGSISVTSGAAMAGVDVMSVMFHGRGGHGSRPETTIDPVVTAASFVTRLQSIVSRNVPPGSLAVVTAGMLQAGTKSNIIPDESLVGISMRSVDPAVRTTMMNGVSRLARGEAIAAGMVHEPTVELTESAAPTVNDPESAERVRAAFARHFGDKQVVDLGTVSGSEDVAVLAKAAQAPLVFWITGGSDPAAFAAAEEAGTVDETVPSNHSPYFAPVLDPTIRVGVDSLVIAAREWLSPATS
jgi:amidohydrolase